MFTWVFVVPTKDEEEEPAQPYVGLRYRQGGEEEVGKWMMGMRTRQFDSRLGKQMMARLLFP